MPAEPTIRAATSQDLLSIYTLALQLGYDVPLSDLERRFVEFSARAGHKVIVAELAGNVVGFANFAAKYDLSYPTWVELMALCVADGARSRGTGATLLRAVEAWTRDNGFAGVTLGTRVTRQDAHRFYEREGFGLEKTQRIYKKAIP